MTTNLKATTTNVIFKWAEEQKLESKGILLSSQLSRDTRWGKAVVSGPDSTINPGDNLLMSARPVVYNFNIDGENLMNTSDASIMAYKRNGILKATCGTIIYEWIEELEKVTESGIIIVEKLSTQEMTPRWAKVHAAGPQSGVNAGDEVLLAFKSDAYEIVIDGYGELHNAGASEVICLRRN